MKRLAPALLALLVLLTLVSAKRRAVGVRPVPQLDLIADRSLVVTEKVILEPFTLRRVLDRITEGTGVTSEAFYRQWWSTQLAPACNELLNGLPRRCPTSAGKLATSPFLPEDFFPIGITNRFDQANATQCGQYRLMFANRQVALEEVFHVIFEAELPNPRPELGVEGCRPVAQFWADLSKIDSLEERRQRLERFFFDGIEGFAPAIHADHYHRNQSGIRSLQFVATPPDDFFPGFFQWRIVRENGTPRMKADVLENAPDVTLINANNLDDRAVRFRQALLGSVKNLAIRDANRYFLRIPKEFLVQDQRAVRTDRDFALNARYFEARKTPAGQAYDQEMAAELQRIGSTLTPFEIVVRAETLTCIGCHFSGTPVGEGVVFPGANDNEQHVTEDGTERAAKFTISPAMRDMFVPHRMKILKDFLLHGKAPIHSN
jgi:hypothetical protein